MSKHYCVNFTYSRAEACYINTGHPEFITGHRAMSVVAERIAQKKVSPMDALKGQPKQDQKPVPPPSLQQAAALNRDHNQELIDSANSGFFGSFFKGAQGKPMQGQMIQVCKI